MKEGVLYKVTDSKKGKRKRNFEGRLIGIYDRYFMFQTKHYRETILKSLVTTGEYTIEEVKKSA